MAYRVKADSDSNSGWSDSDEKESRTKKRRVGMNASANKTGDDKSAKFGVWSDVLIDQTLSAQMSAAADVQPAELSLKVQREAESYEAPKQLLNLKYRKAKIDKKSITQTMKKNNEHRSDVDMQQDDSNDTHASKTAPPPSPNEISDDPFADSLDDFAVDEIGVKVICRPPVTGDLRNRFFHQVDSFRGGYRGPGRAAKRPFNKRGKSGFRGRGRGVSFAGFVSSTVPGYSNETLQSAAFPSGLKLNELGIEMSTALGEVKSDLVVRAVELLGEEHSLELFNATRDIEAGDGMLTNDRKRRRTPGGVFLYLLRQDSSISEAQKDKIFEPTKVDRRKFRYANRTKNNVKDKSFEDSLKELQTLKHKKSQQGSNKESVDVVDEDMKSVQNVAEVIAIQDANMEAEDMG